MVRLENITCPINAPLSIKIDRTPRVYKQADEIERAWDSLCAQNPRYFNGKILTFDSYDPATGVIHARVDEYKNHAVRDMLEHDQSILAVTAMLYGNDEHNMHYLVGQRSPELHCYGGLWELGPSGGVDVPRFRNTLNTKGIIADIAREVSEEIGLKISNPPHHPIAIVHDDEAGSTDIAIQILIDGMPELKTNWEYTQTRWVTIEDLHQWTKNSPEEFIPTTLALIQKMYAKWLALGLDEF